MTVWVGVDLGTQSVRAAAVTDEGEVAAAASHPLTGTRSVGPRGETRHEQDPDGWLAGVRTVLTGIAAAVDTDRVGGICVDATSGTVVLTDERGRPTTPGVMYDDARGADRVARVRDVGAAYWERLGHVPGPTWALPTLMALLDERPGHRVAHQSDVVNAWLTGRDRVPSDPSTALKSGYDLDDDRWPERLFARLGLDAALFPPVVAPGGRLGELGAHAADGTGLRRGTPVLAGMTDGCAAQIGAGAVAPGAWNSVLGTTLVVKGVTEHRIRDPGGAVYAHRSPRAGWWLPGGASSTGAGALAALVDPRRFDALTRRLLDGPPVRPPVAYPLAGRGERFPVDAPDATGFWLDRHGHARPLPDLVGDVGELSAFAAVCDGVAFVERWCYERLAELGADVSGPRTISGGATANAWWNGRRADALGVALRVPATAEPAVGMAVLAGAAAGSPEGRPDIVGAAGRMTRIASVVEPHPTPDLDERYAAFRAAVTERRGSAA